jgi:hypothetical protein
MQRKSVRAAACRALWRTYVSRLIWKLLLVYEALDEKLE